MFRRFLSTTLLLILFSTFAKASQADYQINNDIIKEIENSLLFNDSARKQMNVYRNDNSIKKSDYIINSGKKNNSLEKKSSIDIVLVDDNALNFDLRKKEKLAYNSALIGQYEVAIELFKRVLKKEPKNQYAKFSLAVIYQQIGELEKAKPLYRDLLKDDPNNREEIIGNLLAILIEENPKDASYLLSRLVTQNPNSSYILAQSAVVYDRLKKYQDAISLLIRALEIDPDNTAYAYNLAIAYDKAGQYEQALKYYNEILKSNHEDSENIASKIQIQSRVNAIKGSI